MFQQLIMMENQPLYPPQSNSSTHKIRFNLDQQELSCFISSPHKNFSTHKQPMATKKVSPPLFQLLNRNQHPQFMSPLSLDYGLGYHFAFVDDDYTDYSLHQESTDDNTQSEEDIKTQEIVNQCIRALSDQSTSYCTKLENRQSSKSKMNSSQNIKDQFPGIQPYYKGPIKPEDSYYTIYPQITTQDGRTTLMLRNIPNKYTQQMILQQVSLVGLDAKYDFFYLPIDYKNQCNVGYAFINMVNVEYVPKIYEQFHNKKWAKFNSEKICQVCYARIQGTSKLLNHFRNSNTFYKNQKIKHTLYVNKEASQDEKYPSLIL